MDGDVAREAARGGERDQRQQEDLAPSPARRGLGHLHLVDDEEIVDGLFAYGRQRRSAASNCRAPITLAPRRRAPSRTRWSLDATTTGRRAGAASISSSTTSSASTPAVVNRTCTAGRTGRSAIRSTSAPSNTTSISTPVRPCSSASASIKRVR